jgi:tryptophan 2-monooxygenase
MSILHNINHVLRQSRSRRDIPESTAASFTPWPYVDNLFDFTRVVGDNNVLATGIPAGKRVAIVGAGAAGLCAGFELLKCGIKPTIFEATNRYGGRAWSRHFTNAGGAFAEMGSMRVPPSQRTFGLYAKLFNMQTAAGGFPDPGHVPTVLYYENQAYSWAAGSSPPGIFQAIADDFADWVAFLSAPLYAPWSHGDMVGVRKVWQRYIDTYKDMSFYEAVVQAMPHWTYETRNAFGALGVGSGGFGPLYGVNMLEMLRILLLGWEDNQQLYVNGMTSLCHGFYTTMVNAPGFGRCSLQSLATLQLNTPIAGIDYNPSSKRPMVMLSATSPVEFDAVIVATTSRSMEFMGLTLSAPLTNLTDILSERVKVGLRNLHMASSSKMFICTQTKFWKGTGGQSAPTVPQTIQTDELPRGIYALDYPNTSHGVVLISYTWEDDSIKLQPLDLQQRFAILTASIAKIDATWASNMVPMNGEIYSIDWQSEPYYYGAFKLNLPGQEPGLQAAYYQFMDALSPIHDKGIYLAGDGVSYSGGWTEGALQTAINCATSVAFRCKGVLPSYNALTGQDAHLYDYGAVKTSGRIAPQAA